MMTNGKMTGSYNVNFEIDFTNKTVSLENGIDSKYITEFQDESSLLIAMQDHAIDTVFMKLTDMKIL